MGMDPEEAVEGGEAFATPNESPVEGEDFYHEGSAVVFTAAYHLRRGTCCGSGCRHCPYR